jgi:hypothetical protein
MCIVYVNHTYTYIHICIQIHVCIQLLWRILKENVSFRWAKYICMREALNY